MSATFLPRTNLNAAPPQGLLTLRLRLIGQMEAWSCRDGAHVLPPGRKTRALLALLALTGPRPVLRTRAAETLWSRSPEEQARASLRQEIHRLTVALGPTADAVLLVSREQIGLRPGAVWVDVEEVARATPARPAALRLLDGELLSDLDGTDPVFDVWLASERERLRDRARTLAEHVLRMQQSADSVILAANQVLSIDRAHEGAWRGLMRAHLARGERGLAMQAYERCRAVLAELLDAQPSEETQALVADIRTRAPAETHAMSFELASARAPLRSMHEAAPVLKPPGPVGAVASRPVSRVAPSRSCVRLAVRTLEMRGVPVPDGPRGAELAEGIAAALGRWSDVIAVGPMAPARTARADSADRGAEFDFVLDGTMERAGARWRVTIRLLDAKRQATIWTQSFDRNPDQLGRLKEELAAAAVSRISAYS